MKKNHYIRVLIIAISLLSLFGCAPKQATMPPRLLAALKAKVKTPIICNNDSDCDEMWGKAIYWVSVNSYWKIQTQTPTHILTYGPGSEYSYLAFEVNKIPLESGGNKIVMKAWCGDNFAACKEDPLVAMANFVDYLNSSKKPKVPIPSSAPQPTLGITYAPVTSTIATILKMTEPKGVIVISVSDGSLAEKAAIQKGDVILQYGDRTIIDKADLESAIANTRPGATIPLVIWRHREKITLSVSY
ncbi:MAG: S1C family serine protease [Dissulfurispiraceae bacterium]